MQESDPTQEREKASDEPVVGLRYSRSVVDILEQLDANVLITAFQIGRLLILRVQDGRLTLTHRSYPKPMGVAVAGDRMALGCHKQVWFFDNRPAMSPACEPTCDRFYVPSHSYVTGDIACHEMRFGRSPDAGSEVEADTLWMVNTRFSCLCTVGVGASFQPLWRPKFISGLVPEDRCHLNGMAMIDGRPGFVTALGRSDTRRGWHEHKADGGIIMEPDSGEIISHGWAMPHSPRWHDGRLFVLDSGRGALTEVDLAGGKYETVCHFRGYARGMAMCGRYAFVGLSKARQKRTFGGLPLDAMVHELKCGLSVVDLEQGRIVGSVELTGRCAELFEVQLVEQTHRLEVVSFAGKMLNRLYVLPESLDAPEKLPWIAPDQTGR